MIKTVEIQQYAAILAFDWADDKHDLCLWDRDSNSMKLDVIEHRPEILHAFIQKVRDLYRGRPVAVCLEQSKGALAYLLMSYGFFTIYFVHPGTVKKLRDAWTPSGAKDDPSDAELILDILEKHPEQLRRIDPDDPRTRQLVTLVEARRDLVGERVRITNQLTSNLKGYFPQALACFDDLASTMACDFLRNWPSLGEAKRVREATLREFFHAHGVRGESRIDERIALLRDSLALTTDAGVLLPALMATKILVEELRVVLAGIVRYERAIEKAFKAHPDAGIFASLPGAGPTFAPRLLALFGSNRERWPDAASLQQYLGVAPVTERSGNKHWVHWRWACPKFLRQSVVEWAGMSIRYSVWAAAFYQDQRKRGKTHNVAIRALAFKWLRIVHRCWMDRKPYDEALYLKALQKSGSPLLATIAGQTAPAR